MKKRDKAAGLQAAGQFVLEVMPDGTFKWRFKNLNVVALLGMLDCAAHELREKVRAGEFEKKGDT
jgi:hypothetical protein